MILQNATINQLSELVQMNIALRNDEKIDNVMSIDQVKERMENFLLGDVYKVFTLHDDNKVIGYCVIDLTTPPYI